MKDNDFKLANDYSNAMRFRMPYKRLMIVAVSFLLAGIFTMIKGSYSSLVPYVLVAVAVAAWLYIERQATSVFFGKEQLTVRKGFLIFKNWRAIVIPYSQLISFKTNDENAGRLRFGSKQSGSASVSYYHKEDFYKDVLHMSPVQPAFDELCKELKRNDIFVTVKV